MKRIIATVFLFIFISVSSLATFAEDSYPVEGFIAYWRYSTDGTTWTQANVTSTSSRDGLVFHFPTVPSGLLISRLELVLVPYSGSPSVINNLYNVHSISGTFHVYSQGNSGTLGNLQFTIYNQVYDSTLGWSVDGQADGSNGSSFFIEPSNGISTRINFVTYNYSVLGPTDITFSFSELYINDVDYIDKIHVDEAISDFESQSDNVLSSISDFETFQNDAFEAMVDVTNDINNVSSYVSDVSTFLEDSYEAVALYTGTFAVINNFSIISGFIVIVAVFMVVSYIIFGRAG